MILIERNKEVVLLDGKVKPDYYVSDESYNLIANNKEFREMTLESLNKNSLIIARLGKLKNDKEEKYVSYADEFNVGGEISWKKKS